MNYGELVLDVRTKVKDERPDVLVSIPDYINEAYLWACEEVIIPSLKTMFTVVTVLGQAYTNMPTNFDGRLKYAGTTDGELTVLDGGVIELLERNPDISTTGTLCEVAVENNILWYAQVPTTETSIICLGMYKPTLLSAATDEPSHIPELYHRDILSNYAAKIAYSVIEDGIEEGLRANTKFYDEEAKKGVQKLRVWAERRKGNIRRGVWNN